MANLSKSIMMAAFILALPCFLGIPAYRKDWHISRTFYTGMLLDVRFRKSYEKLFFFGCCMIHLGYLMMFHNPCHGLISSVLMCLFLNERLCHKLLTSLQNRRCMFLAMLVSLAALFTNGMYTTAVVIYMFIVASSFYPSRKAFRKFQHYESLRYYMEHTEEIKEIYYKY